MSLSPDRTQLPAFHPVTKIHLPQAERKTLSNGIPVFLLDAGSQELVKIEFLFTAGIRHQTQSLVAVGVNDMLDEGTHTRNAESIAEELDYYGAFIETEASHDNASFTLFSLNKHLPSTLPVVQDILRNAAFPEKEFNIYLSNKKQKFLVDSEKVSFLARRRFSELIFGATHPYGKKAELADFDLLSRNALQQFFSDRYIASDCTIIVSGKLPKNILQQLDALFGKESWGKELPVETGFPQPLSEKERIQTIEKKGALQSAIRMGRLLFNKEHPEYLGMQVLNTVLGGYFGSRLMSNIREDKGYTYGIGSGVVSMHKAGYFVISTEVGVDVTNAALKEIYFEIEKLQNDLIPAGELDLVRNYLSGVFLRSTDGPFAQADRLKGLLGYDLGYDYYDRYLETIRTITPQHLRQLAQDYLKKEDLVELVVGGRK